MMNRHTSRKGTRMTVSRILAACLLLSAPVAYAGNLFETFVGEAEDVSPGELLDISFVARSVAGASIETRPDCSNLLTVASCIWRAAPEGARFPAITVKFFKADAKPLKPIWVTQGRVLVWSKQPQAFRHSVYVPDGAVRAQLCIERMEKENAVEVLDISFRHLDGFAQPTRNINPFFDYGLFNSSGYTFMGSPRWRVDADGCNWFDLLQGSCYPDPFPVKGDEEIEIRFRGDSPTWLHCYVCFYPEWKDVGSLNMNKVFFILQTGNKSHRPERVKRLKVPADATWARVYFQPSGEIHDLRITGVASEEDR